MATIQNFEDIDAWQKARELTKAIYACSGTGDFAKDFALREQIRRAVISIISNISEGFERGGSAEFSQFLSIVKGSAGEVESQLYIALDQGYITKEEFNSLRLIVASTKKLISGFMNYLKQSSIKGQKFKKTTNQRPETINHKP